MKAQACIWPYPLLALLSLGICFGDSIKIAGHTLDKVVISDTANDYIIRNPVDGSVQKVFKKRADVGAVAYSHDRDKLLEEWRRKQQEQATREDEEVRSREKSDENQVSNGVRIDTKERRPVSYEAEEEQGQNLRGARTSPQMPEQNKALDSIRAGLNSSAEHAGDHNEHSPIDPDLLKAAERGDANAQRALGLCYARGEGASRDDPQAAKWFRKAAEQGDAGAQRCLGGCYALGRGVALDKAEAVKWYRRAADQGDAEAQSLLESTVIAAAQEKETVDVSELQRLADRGLAHAAMLLGDCHADGRGVPQDAAEAVTWYKKAAEQGDVDAQCKLAACYSEGAGVEQDLTEAGKWYRKAAEQGNADAQFLFGFLYEYGVGLPKDETEAAKWFWKAAQQGHTAGQRCLADCFANGVGVPEDSTEAVKWYSQAAGQGDLVAQRKLGLCYLHGIGIPTDEEEGLERLRRAAAQGDAEAQCELGSCYYAGKVVEQDYEEAAKWFQKAAEQGHGFAQFSLSTCYLIGQGVPQDLAESDKWLKLSRRTVEVEKLSVEKLKRTLSRQELHEVLKQDK